MYKIESKKALVSFLTLIFCTSFYLMGPIRIAGDVVPATLLPFSIVLNHNIYLDKFVEYYKKNDTQTKYFYNYDSHYISSYPITLPLIISPIYIPLKAFYNFNKMSVEQIIALAYKMGKFVSALITSLSVMFFFILSENLLQNTKKSIFLSIVYAFATENWAIASNSLWQHGFSELMIILCFISILKLENNIKSKTFSFLLGLFLALAISERPTDIVFAVPVFLYILIYKNNYLIYFLLPLALIGSGLITFNLMFFKRLTGGYDANFNGNIFKGIIGLLFSPGRGLLIYTPITIFSFVGLILSLKNNKIENKIYPIASIFIIGQILLIAKWNMWWGGWTYGPRLLTDIVPALILLLAPILAIISKNKIILFCFTSLVMISIFIQIMGRFFVGGYAWNSYYSVDKKPSCLWNIKDSPILWALEDKKTPALH